MKDLMELPMTTKPTSDDAFEALAMRFRALGDPLRLKILYNLVEGECMVTELIARTGGSQSNVSKHLSTLLTHDLVQRRRAGTSAYYSITDESILELCNRVCEGIDRNLEKRRKAFR
jgi:DNA-binding transcriptional ArsR family regulator